MIETKKLNFPYLVLPANHALEPEEITIRSGGEFLHLKIVPGSGAAMCYRLPYDEYEVEASDAFFRAAEWKGESITPPPSADEVGRLQFHYSPASGWLNDPNGLYYHKGEWHMFHQYNPLGTGWGNMHWNHAVSRDLLHWRELGITLYPDSIGTMFSGNGWVDRDNVSGLGEGGEAPILLFYTNAGYGNDDDKRAFFTQNLAYSTDGGKSFRKYEFNPLVGSLFACAERDPFVAFDEESGKYIMALFLDTPGMEFGLLESDNLLAWRLTDRFRIPGGRECPCIFRLRDEASGRMHWVFLEANGLYRVGAIQGGRFVFEGEAERLFPKIRRSFYAAQTFSNAPGGKVILQAWLREQPTGFRSTGAMALPVELKLHDAKLLVSPAVLPERGEGGGFAATVECVAEKASFALKDFSVTFDFSRHTLTLNGEEFPLEQTGRGGRFFADTRSIEYFSDDGRTWFGLMIEGGPAKPECSGLNITDLHTLKSIWC